jgi:exodeoxyribonuclease VII small subunit
MTDARPRDEALPSPLSPAEIAELPFDRALAALQAVVARLEGGGLPLEASIDLYEQGVALHERCTTLLDAAELRVQRLVEGAGGSLRLMDLRPDELE